MKLGQNSSAVMAQSAVTAASIAGPRALPPPWHLSLPCRPPPFHTRAAAGLVIEPSVSIADAGIDEVTPNVVVQCMIASCMYGKVRPLSPLLPIHPPHFPDSLLHLSCCSVPSTLNQSDWVRCRRITTTARRPSCTCGHCTGRSSRGRCLQVSHLTHPPSGARKQSSAALAD